MRLHLSLPIAFAAALLGAPVHAQAVTVIGGGLARDCYVAVETGRGAVADALRTCDLALAQEQMTRRNKAATHVNRGILYMRMERFDRATADFKSGMQGEPDLLEAKVNYGAALYGLKRYDEALAALNEGVKADDVRARSIGYYNRGLTHEKLGNVQDAYYDFRTSLELQPDFELATQQLSRFQVVPASQQP